MGAWAIQSLGAKESAKRSVPSLGKGHQHGPQALSRQALQSHFQKAEAEFTWQSLYHKGWEG